MQALPIFQRLRKINKWIEEESGIKAELIKIERALKENIKIIRNKLTQEDLDELDIKYYKTLLTNFEEDLEFNKARLENCFWRTNLYKQQANKIPLG